MAEEFEALSFLKDEDQQFLDYRKSLPSGKLLKAEAINIPPSASEIEITNILDAYDHIVWWNKTGEKIPSEKLEKADSTLQGLAVSLPMHETLGIKII